MRKLISTISLLVAPALFGQSHFDQEMTIVPANFSIPGLDPISTERLRVQGNLSVNAFWSGGNANALGSTSAGGFTNDFSVGASIGVISVEGTFTKTLKYEFDVLTVGDGQALLVVRYTIQNLLGALQSGTLVLGRISAASRNVLYPAPAGTQNANSPADPIVFTRQSTLNHPGTGAGHWQTIDLSYRTMTVASDLSWCVVTLTIVTTRVWVPDGNGSSGGVNENEN